MSDIIFLLDESISMSNYSKNYINIINSFIKTQKTIKDNSIFTLVKFNTYVKTLCLNSYVDTLPEFTDEHYSPDGTTSLYDAIGYAMHLKYSDILKNKAIMFILTDGQDNNSSKYNILDINNQIKYLKNIGWDFIYIATGQNAFEFGKRIGIDSDKCIYYSESTNSISKISNTCNIALGHFSKKISGYHNIYSDMTIETDISDLNDLMGCINI